MQRSHSTRLGLLAALTSGALAACSGSQSPRAATLSSPAAASAPTQADWIARGEYVVRIAGCNDCHTPGYAEQSGKIAKAQWLVGSPLGYHGPWGTTYAANLRLKAMEMDEAGWLNYTGELHTRPIMPDFALREMHEADRRAMYRFIRSLGPAGGQAPDYLPPGQTPPLPYFQLVLPPAPQGAPAQSG